MDEETNHGAPDSKNYSVSRRRFLQALSAVSILGMPWTTAEGAAAPPDFSFVYIADAHLVTGQPDTSFKMLQESQLFLQESIKSINALKPNFVIFGGDQVEGPGKDDKNWQLFIDLAQSLTCPWYFVLGESDISGKPPADKMKTYGLDFKGRGNSSPNPYWSADPMPGLHLIGLDTSVANSSIGEIEEEQLKWLKSDLAANRGKFTIVVSHHPLLAPPPYDGGPPWDDYVLPNGADAREMLATSPDVRMVLSGHLYLNKVQLENNVFHVSSAGLNVYPCEYKQFVVNKTGITMKSYEVPFPALIKKANKVLVASTLSSRFNRQKPDAILNLCEGEEQDQNAFFSLGSNKTIRPLSKKELKEQQKVLEDRLAKDKEDAAKKSGKDKDKKGDGKSEDKKSDSKSDKKSEETKSEDKKGSDSKKSSTEKSSYKKSSSKKSKSPSDSTEPKGTDDTGSLNTDPNPADAKNDATPGASSGSASPTEEISPPTKSPAVESNPPSINSTPDSLDKK